MVGERVLFGPSSEHRHETDEAAAGKNLGLVKVGVIIGQDKHVIDHRVFPAVATIDAKSGVTGESTADTKFR